LSLCIMMLDAPISAIAGARAAAAAWLIRLGFRSLHALRGAVRGLLREAVGSPRYIYGEPRAR
jgi:hypothetical protein